MQGFPPRRAILSTYRGLVRASNPKLNSLRARESTLDSVFVDQLNRLYRKQQPDPKTAWRNHIAATELLALLKSSTTHAEAMFDGGWCLNKPQMGQVKNVAGYVGLDIPIPTYGELNPSEVRKIGSTTPRKQ